MKLNKKITIILALVILAVISLLYVAAQYEAPEAEVSLEITEQYFVDGIQGQALNRLDAHPIEGLEQSMYILTHPGLVANDFRDVQTYGDLNNAEVQTTADDTVTINGLVQLLENTADRLQVPTETTNDIDSLLVLLSQDQSTTPVNTSSSSESVIGANTNHLTKSCVAAGGTWLAEHLECEYISQEWCSEQSGNFQECSSACRHQPDAQICTMQCVPVCQL